MSSQTDYIVASSLNHIQGVNAADELLRLDKDKFFKFYKDVSQQLEACLDKLLCIKAQLADEETDDNDNQK